MPTNAISCCHRRMWMCVRVAGCRSLLSALESAVSRPLRQPPPLHTVANPVEPAGAHRRSQQHAHRRCNNAHMHACPAEGRQVTAKRLLTFRNRHCFACITFGGPWPGGRDSHSEASEKEHREATTCCTYARDDAQAVDHLANDHVLAVALGRRRKRDVELAGVGVLRSVARHGRRAAQASTAPVA